MGIIRLIISFTWLATKINLSKALTKRSIIAQQLSLMFEESIVVWTKLNKCRQTNWLIAGNGWFKWTSRLRKFSTHWMSNPLPNLSATFVESNQRSFTVVSSASLWYIFTQFLRRKEKPAIKEKPGIWVLIELRFLELFLSRNLLRNKRAEAPRR